MQEEVLADAEELADSIKDGKAIINDTISRVRCTSLKKIFVSPNSAERWKSYAKSSNMPVKEFDFPTDDIDIFGILRDVEHPIVPKMYCERSRDMSRNVILKHFLKSDIKFTIYNSVDEPMYKNTVVVISNSNTYNCQILIHKKREIPADINERNLYVNEGTLMDMGRIHKLLRVTKESKCKHVGIVGSNMNVLKKIIEFYEGRWMSTGPVEPRIFNSSPEVIEGIKSLGIALGAKILLEYLAVGQNGSLNIDNRFLNVVNAMESQIKIYLLSAVTNPNICNKGAMLVRRHNVEIVKDSKPIRPSPISMKLPKTIVYQLNVLYSRITPDIDEIYIADTNLKGVIFMLLMYQHYLDPTVYQNPLLERPDYFSSVLEAATNYGATYLCQELISFNKSDTAVTNKINAAQAA